MYIRTYHSSPISQIHPGQTVQLVSYISKIFYLILVLRASWQRHLCIFIYVGIYLSNFQNRRRKNPSTRALLGLWIFHRLLGGGGRLNATPMISAPGRRREKRKAAFESSRKIISKSFRSFFGSGENWGHQGSKFQNFTKRFFDNKIVNFKGFFVSSRRVRRFLRKVCHFHELLITFADTANLYHRVCLVKARRTIYKMTLKGQGQSLTSGQVRPRSRDDRNGSYCISLDSPGQDERTDTNPTSLSLFDQKLLANDGWWPRVTSNDLSRGRQWKFLLELSTTVLYDMIPLK